MSKEREEIKQEKERLQRDRIEYEARVGQLVTEIGSKLNQVRQKDR